MKATFFKHTLQFITPGKTSRNTLLKKDSWFLVLKKEANYGIGECSIIRGLSLDNSDKIDLIYDEAIKQGAIGGKLLGAGGGGFLLFYVPKEKQKNFLKKFKKIISIKFNFTNQASSIIYNSNNAQGN